MSVKEKLLEYVADLTRALTLDALPDELTAQSLGERFQVKRNTVSYYLNMAVEEGILVKIESRPVYFFTKKLFEEAHYPLKKNIYPSAQAIMEEGRVFQTGKEKKSCGSTGDGKDRAGQWSRSKEDGFGEEQEKTGEEDSLDTSAFSRLIGYDKSLNQLIQKVKASVLYPGTSLPFMIHGATGVGKSFLAQIIHQFCCDNGIISRDAPFVPFNCAQYANNPELMSSKLFGHVKGAYTGAVSDSAGVIDAADGGILFLDEAHRLSKENQEKLFTFLDYGKFSRLGESNRWHRADVRIILATTEDIRSSFLETFRRRIPINISIPGLNERSDGEKEQLIYSFFISERRLMKKDIFVPEHIFDILMRHRYDANVGELQATIKYMCASAYSRCRRKEDITVTYWDFSEEFLRQEEDIKAGGEQPERRIRIAADSTAESLMESDSIRQALEKVLINLTEIRSGMWPSVGAEEMDRAMAEQIGYFASYFSRQYFLLYREQEERKNGNGLKSLVSSWLQSNNYLKSRHINDTVSQMFSRYLYFRYYNLKGLEELITEPVRELYRYCRGKFMEEAAMVEEFSEYFKERLQISFHAVDKLFFILYLRRCGARISSNRIYPVLVGHGMATAMSMAETVNGLLGARLFEAVDILSGETERQIFEEVEQAVRGRGQYSSVMLLWDTEMTASEENMLERNLKMETLLLDRMSTQDVLETGRMILSGKKLSEISRGMREAAVRKNKIFNRGERQSPVIVCSCFTGIATAMRMENIIRESIPEDVNLKIVSCGFGELKAEGVQHEIFRRYQVIGIIGTANPRISGIPYIPLEEMIVQSENDVFKSMLKTVATEEQTERILNELLCNFSVERLIDTLTILDTKKTIKNIENCILRYEAVAHTSLTGRTKTCLYIHISCLLERLIRQLPVDSFQGLEEFKENRQKEIHLIRQAFGQLEEIYHVQIPIEEIGYIYNILCDEELNGGE